MKISDVYNFLVTQKLGVLSSISPEGTSQSALVGVAVTNNFEIIFDTLSTTRKFKNLKSNPRCSFVIGWQAETTVQLEGVAFSPEGSELGRYQQLYFIAWPDGPTRLTWPGMTHFVVRPLWLRYSDYDQNPPLIQEFTFD